MAADSVTASTSSRPIVALDGGELPAEFPGGGGSRSVVRLLLGTDAGPGLC